MFDKYKHIKKTKKDHQCYYCNKIIPTGSSCGYYMVVGCSEIANGKLQEGYICEDCSKPDDEGGVEDAERNQVSSMG